MPKKFKSTKELNNHFIFIFKFSSFKFRSGLKALQASGIQRCLTKRGLFSDPVGKQNAVQLPVPVNICFFHLITEFLAFQEGLLCCSVESLHFTICLGVIRTCDVMSNACELVELLSNLENRTNTKKMLNYMVVHKYHGRTLWSLHEARLLYKHESHTHLINKFSPLVRNVYL